MTWNIRDTIPRTPQGVGRKKKAGAKSTVVEVFQGQEDGSQEEIAGVPPAATMTDDHAALPTFAHFLDDPWEGSDRVPPEVERELNTMGMITNRQWDAWARLCRRGLYEI